MKCTVGEILGLILVIVIFSIIAQPFKDDKVCDVITTAWNYPLVTVAATENNRETLTRLEGQLWLHEGFRSKAYLCPAGILTVGVGRNIQDKGITREEALYLLRNDIKECRADLRTIFPGFDVLSEDRSMVLIDMRFNLGHGGFREFEDMIQAVRDGNFTLAAHEMMDSLWYKQVGDRSSRLSDMMLGVKI